MMWRLLTMFISVAFIWISGCRKAENIRRIVVENACREIIQSERVPQRTKELARKVLDDWANGVVDPAPVLVHAGYGFHKHGYRILLTMSDEDHDIAGLIIQETHALSDTNVLVIEEDYPVFPAGIIGSPQLLPFRKRDNLSQRKDLNAWNHYLRGDANQIDLTYRRREYPTIWISIPDPPLVQVRMRIYDSRGNKSGWVPVEYGPPVYDRLHSPDAHTTSGR